MTDLERAQAMDKWAVNSSRQPNQAKAEQLAETWIARRELDHIIMWPISMSVGWIVFARQLLQGRVN